MRAENIDRGLEKLVQLINAGEMYGHIVVIAPSARAQDVFNWLVGKIDPSFVQRASKASWQITTSAGATCTLWVTTEARAFAGELKVLRPALILWITGEVEKAEYLCTMVGHGGRVFVDPGLGVPE